jgi:hypothetical protein
MQKIPHTFSFTGNEDKFILFIYFKYNHTLSVKTKEEKRYKNENAV